MYGAVSSAFTSASTSSRGCVPSCRRTLKPALSSRAASSRDLSGHDDQRAPGNQRKREHVRASPAASERTAVRPRRRRKAPTLARYAAGYTRRASSPPCSLARIRARSRAFCPMPRRPSTTRAFSGGYDTRRDRAGRTSCTSCTWLALPACGALARVRGLATTSILCEASRHRRKPKLVALACRRSKRVAQLLRPTCIAAAIANHRAPAPVANFTNAEPHCDRSVGRRWSLAMFVAVTSDELFGVRERNGHGERKDEGDQGR